MAENDTSNINNKINYFSEQVNNDLLDENGLPKIDVNYEKDAPKDMSTNVSQLQSKSNYLSRYSEKGLVNEQTGSAMVIRDNGQINLSAGMYSQYKLNPNGKSVEQTMESNTFTNRKNINTNDLVINGHKLNPSLYELTNFQKVILPLNQEAIVGNFCVSGTVLVKAWEPNLKRYMLIRRPVRMPMFSDLLNVPEINTGIKVSDPYKLEEDILAKSDKGYLVNSEIKDEKSLIGKEGVNRGGSAGTAQVSSAGNGGDMHNASLVEAGYQEIAGQTMQDGGDGSNGCVMAVVRIGYKYSKFLAQEKDKNEANVDNLLADASSAGLIILDFAPSSLSSGDVIVYAQDNEPCHVVIATGNGNEYVGNSTSQKKVVKGSDYNSMGTATPYKIIKTSVA